MNLLRASDLTLLSSSLWPLQCINKVWQQLTYIWSFTSQFTRANNTKVCYSHQFPLCAMWHSLTLWPASLFDLTKPLICHTILNCHNLRQIFSLILGFLFLLCGISPHVSVTISAHIRRVWGWLCVIEPVLMLSCFAPSLQKPGARYSDPRGGGYPW